MASSNGSPLYYSELIDTSHGVAHWRPGRSRYLTPLFLLVAAVTIACAPARTAVAPTDTPLLQPATGVPAASTAPPAQTARNATPAAVTPAADKSRRDLTEYTESGGQPVPSKDSLRAQAATVDDLTWLASSPLIPTLVGTAAERPLVLAAKQQAIASGNRSAEARANALLASEAFNRASSVIIYWLDSRDLATGLIASVRPSGRPIDEDRGWFYQDTAADLFPHIAIGAMLLHPDRYPEMISIMEAERRLAPPSPALPDDLLLPGGRRAGHSDQVRMFGAAEYGKDGLLPLIERLGLQPWLGRLREINDAIIRSAATPTRRGVIPADSNEMNGSVLQDLTRGYLATGDERYYAMADRIGRSYVEDMMPKTEWLPVNQWDFIKNQPIDRRRLRLSDHGNEIVAGLVSWELVESLRNEPDAPAHRHVIELMLDRMLGKGRNPDSFWYRVIEIPEGIVDQGGLSDNWGYLYQAFMTQAQLERTLPDGDIERAGHYEQAVVEALHALPKYPYYQWQRGEMDGYADSIEGALDLLPRIPDAGASAWVDEQAAVLFGFQHADGSVENNYLDGNFVRTVLQYGLSLTGGTWVEPWRPDVALGAVVSGPCLELSLASVKDWQGVVHFDATRSRDNARLPMNFPRLNEWPENFSVQADVSYSVDGDTNWAGAHSGRELMAGVPISLSAGATGALRVCPAG